MRFIDALRGYAILAVILGHVAQNGAPLNSDLGNILLVRGDRGVQLFFIVSAMTLFYSFNVSKEVRPFSAKDFFIRRFFRLAPMFYIGIVYFSFQKFHQGQSVYNFDNIFSMLSAFAFMQSAHPYWVSGLVPGGWSISVEFQFYLLLPFLFYFIRNQKQAFNLFLFSIILRVGLQSILLSHPFVSNPWYWQSFLIYYLPNQFPTFTIGIFLYFFIFKDESKSEFNSWQLIILIAILLFQSASASNLLIPENISVSLLLGVIVWIFAKYNNRILVNPIINFIGKISFSLYLVHFAVVYWLNYLHIFDLFQNTYVNFINKVFMTTVISVGLSYLFYNLIEVPFQKIGLRLINHKSKVAKAN